MFGWMRRKPPGHVCEEWTQWKVCTETYWRFPDPSDGVLHTMYPTIQIPTFEHWQERQCTICGFIQQDPLDNREGCHDQPYVELD